MRLVDNFDSLTASKIKGCLVFSATSSTCTDRYLFEQSRDFRPTDGIVMLSSSRQPTTLHACLRCVDGDSVWHISEVFKLESDESKTSNRPLDLDSKFIGHKKATRRNLSPSCLLNELV